MLGAVAASWVNFIALYLSVLAPATTCTGLLMRPSWRHGEFEGLRGFTCRQLELEGFTATSLEEAHSRSMAAEASGRGMGKLCTITGFVENNRRKSMNGQASWCSRIDQLPEVRGISGKWLSTCGRFELAEFIEGYLTAREGYGLEPGSQGGTPQ